MTEPANDRETAPAIALDDLWRRYGRSPVLRGVALEVAPGRIVVLRGGNGAGKTTLLRVLATRLRPSRGRGRVFGFDLVRDAHQVRCRVALLPVAGGSYPTLTAFENLRLAARLWNTADDRAALEARLEQVGLADARDKLVRTFSSGMKKRLGLARLRLAGASLWLLDEPYAALDEAGKTLVDALLAEARAAGRTVLLASHERQRSAALADATLELEGGRLRAAPGPREVARA